MTLGFAWNWIAVYMRFNNPASTKDQNMTILHFKKSINRSVPRLALLLIPLMVPALRLYGGPRRLSRRQTAAIPGSPRRKEPTLFKASPPALRIQRLVGVRSFATQRAASTPPPARGRSFSTPQTTILRLARRRYYSTPAASTTRLLEQPLF